MKIINGSNHINFLCSSDLKIESSHFFHVKSNVSKGGVIFVNTSLQISLNSVLFENCSSLDDGGALYAETKSRCALFKVCFSNCLTINFGNGQEGSSAMIKARNCSSSFKYSSIYQCSPLRDSGYLCFRSFCDDIHIEDINCSHCKNKHYSGFAINNPKEGSEMKFCQLSHMTGDALHIEYCALISFRKCNFINNTDDDCIAIRTYSENRSDFIVFREIIFWGNSRQIIEEFAKAVHKFIDSTTDKDFGECLTENCETSMNDVSLFDVDSPFECFYQLTLYGRKYMILLGYFLVNTILEY